MNKNDILEYFLGDLVRDLMDKNQMYLFIIPCVALLWIEMYFLVFRHHKKGSKYSTKDKIYLGLAIYMTLLFIAMQVFFSVRYFQGQ